VNLYVSLLPFAVSKIMFYQVAYYELIFVDSILPGEDSEVGGVLKRVFQKEGITITGSNMKQVKPLSATGHEGTCCDGTIVSSIRRVRRYNLLCWYCILSFF
jgi:hypothetical protein